MEKSKVTVNDIYSIADSFLEGFQSEEDESTVGQSVWNGIKNAGTELMGMVASNKVEEKLNGTNKAIRSIVGESVGVGVKHVIAGSEEWFQQQKDRINELKNHYMTTEGLNERTAWWKVTKQLLEGYLH